MPVLDYIDDIATELHDAQIWRERQDQIAAHIAYYKGNPGQGGRIVEAIARYPGIPYGILDAIVRDGRDLNDPGTQQLLAYAYGREVQAGSYNMGKQVLAKFARRKNSPGEANADDYESDTTKPTLLGIPDHPKVQEAYAKALEGGLENDQGIWKQPIVHNLQAPQAYAFRQLQEEYWRAGMPFVYQDRDGLIHKATGKQQMDNTTQQMLWRAADDQVLNPDQNTDNRDSTSLSNPYAPLAKYQRPSAQGLSSLKKVSQASAMIGDFAQQEVTGLARAGYAAAHGKGFNPSWQSDLALYLQDNNLSPGNGYFVDPDTTLARKRREVEAQYGQIYGHNLSVGRIIASRIPVFDGADDIPFKLVSGLIDGAKQLADPVALSGKYGAKLSATRELFAAESLVDDLDELDELDEAAGLFHGIRRQFDGDKWSAFSASHEGRSIKQTIAGYNPSVPGATSRRLWEVMGRQHDPALVESLFNTTTEDEVDDLIKGVIGTQIRSKNELDKIPGFLGGRPSTVNELLDKLYSNGSDLVHNNRVTSRFLDFLPESSVDIRNRTHVADNLLKWAKLGKASPKVMDDAFTAVANADSREAFFKAVTDVMDAEDGVLAAHGVKDASSRRALTQLYRQRQNDELDVLIKDVASNSSVQDLIINNGEAVQSLSPQLSIELIQNRIPLPDINRIRRTLRHPSYRWLTTNMTPADIGQNSWPAAAMVGFTEKIFKPAALLGRFPAWITRVVGEEQVRMVVGGLNNALNHPFSAIAHGIARKPFNPAITPSGDTWDHLEELESVVLKGHGGIIRRPGAAPVSPRAFDKLRALEHDDYMNSWATQVAVLNKAPESNYLLNSNVEDTVAWLWSDEGANTLHRLQTAFPEKFATRGDTLNWVQRTLVDRVHTISGDDPDVLDAIKTGTYKGTPIFDKKGRVSKDFIANLTRAKDDVGPRFVKGFDPMDAEYRTRLDKATDWAFGHTMTPATNKFSRIPAIKQYTWKHTVEMLPFATKEVQEQVLENARQGKVSNRLMKSLVAATKRGAEGKIDNIDTLTHLAGGYAADSTKRLLYDLSRRGLVAEQLKIAIPFGNAFQEIFSTYAKMMWGKQYGLGGKVAKTVQVTRRAQQVIQGGHANGWFMKDQYGDEVFVFPFSEAINQRMTGIPLPMTGRVQGLNMVGDIMPGLGPVASVPLAAMRDGKPETVQEVINRLLPYGAPGERSPDDVSNALSYMPAWMQKMALAISVGPPPGIDMIPGIDNLWPKFSEAWWDNRAWMGAQISVEQYLMTTGDYDLSTPGGFQKLMEDAKEKAKDAYYVRAAMQFFAPTAPTWQWIGQDATGHNVAVSAVTEEFYKHLSDGMDMDQATEALMDKYGTDIFNLVVPKTKGVTWAIPRTEDAYRWMTRNEDIVSKYPASYGFFAPQTGKFDYRVLQKQIARGEIEALSPRDWPNLRNETLKTMQYNYYKDKIGPHPTQEQQTFLRNIRISLEEDYPSTTTGIPQKPETPEAIAELRRAMVDPSLQDNPVSKALQEYFYYYDKAMSGAKTVDPDSAGFQNAKRFYPVRQFMSNIAHQLLDDYPQFDTVWTYVLAKEYEQELR